MLQLTQGPLSSCSSRVCASCHRSLGRSPLRPGVSALSHRVVRTYAIAEEDKTGIDAEKIGVLKYSPDTESWADVMAFKGPAPERVNGRIAMMAFLLISIGELTSGRSVVEQLERHPLWTFVFATTLSVASVLPKLVSGTALNDLHEAASRDGLPQNLRFFNKIHEVWVGRVAMLGLSGLILVEALVTKGALFHRG